jgi:hypothetical protein
MILGHLPPRLQALGATAEDSVVVAFWLLLRLVVTLTVQAYSPRWLTPIECVRRHHRHIEPPGRATG